MRSGVAKVVEVVSGPLAVAGLLICTLTLGIYGIGRSLWLDEAWVANSVHAPTLREMFVYPDWLQTSPPLFLLLARGAVGVFGLSNVSLRLVPLLFALVAVGAMLAVARRVVSAPYAALACAAMAFHPTAVEYFRSVKQYSGEVAATALILLVTVWYLQSPGRREFYWLTGTVAVAMALSYPTVFLLPGVLWVIRGDLRRSALLAGIAGGVLAILYWWFIRPNVSDALRVYWSAGGHDLRTIVITGAVAAGVVATLMVWPRFGVRGQMAIVCVLPYVLAAIAEGAGWYPQSPRTSLFLRPCLVLFLAMVGAEVFGRWKFVDALVCVLAILTVALGVRKQFHEGRFQPEEDFDGVVRYLNKNAGPNDIVLVHASMREGFLLYTAMQGWRPAHAVFADTGWPCCPRGKDARPGSSTERAVIEDLDAKISRDFVGTIWLFHSARPTHWDYTGLDEGEAWQRYFWNRGCRPGPYIRFPNLGITPVICAGNSL